jgi:predicted phosphoribosyltransferase
MNARLRNRADAGKRLSAQLQRFANRDDVIVLALPRGGVPTGFELAKSLHAPLDVFVVRKLGVPGHEELAMGAIATGGVRVLNQRIVANLGIPTEAIEAAARVEEREIARRERVYRGGRPPLDVRGKTVILVDDGLATGATMIVAIEALRSRHPGRIVAAAGVGAAETCQNLTRLVGECVCALEPPALEAISKWYEDFTQTEDAEVRALLSRADHHSVGAKPSAVARSVNAAPARSPAPERKGFGARVA